MGLNIEGFRRTGMPREYYLLPSLSGPFTRNVEFETGWTSNSNTNAKTLPHGGSCKCLQLTPNPTNAPLEFVSGLGSEFGSGFGVRVWGHCPEFGSEFGSK